MGAAKFEPLLHLTKSPALADESLELIFGVFSGLGASKFRSCDSQLVEAIPLADAGF